MTGGPLPVLTFHDLSDGPPPLAFPPALFESLLEGLAQRGWRALRLAEAADVTRGGPAPARSVVITFDDGSRSVFDRAMPVLRRLKMTATVFVATGTSPPLPELRLPPLGDREMLSWAELRELAASGLDIGAHTMSHPDLTRLSDDDVRREMAGSKDILEGFLGRPAACFAYPFGRHDRRVRELAAATGFACAVTDRLSLVRRGDDPLALPRVDMHYLRRPSLARLLGGPLLAPYLAARSVPRAARRLLGGAPR